MEQPDRCLSQLHKRAQSGEHTAGEVTPAVLEVWRGATCVKSTRELVWKCCVECNKVFSVERWKSVKYERCVMCRVTVRECVHCGESFEVKGRDLRTMRVLVCPNCGGENTGAVRGDVTRFSERSRRELMFQLNTLEKGIDTACFATLTFPDSFYPLNEDLSLAKEYLRRFEFRFRRAFPGACYVWRMEVEDRKSGKHVGALFPHFHLLVFGVGLADLRVFVAGDWHEIAGFSEVEHLKVHQHNKTVTPVYSRKAVLGYASKAVGAVMSSEVAKTVQAVGGKVGRWWGTVNKGSKDGNGKYIDGFHALQAVPVSEPMNDGDTVVLFRFFRGFIRGSQLGRYFKAVEKARKVKKAEPRRPYKLKARQVRSMTVYMDGETFWNRVLSILSSAGVCRFRVTGREIETPFWKWAYDSGLWVPAVEG